MRSSILKYRVKKERNNQSKSQNYPLQVEIDNLIKYLVCSFIWINFFLHKTPTINHFFVFDNRYLQLPSICPHIIMSAIILMGVDQTRKKGVKKNQ